MQLWPSALWTALLAFASTCQMCAAVQATTRDSCMLQVSHVKKSLARARSPGRLALEQDSVVSNSTHVAGSAAGFAQLAGATKCVICAVCLLIPLSLMMMIIGGSPLPQPKVGNAHLPAVYPPVRVLVFTAIICIGVMANVTVILPSATHVASSASQSAEFSGILIGQYSAGAFVGLYFFTRLPIDHLWGAYIAHAFIMLVGNGVWALGAKVEGPYLLCIARMLVGLEGGCMYNSALAMTHFAKGPAYTACLVLYQFFIAVGVLLGPSLAAVGAAIGESFGPPFDTVLANAVMSLWGAMLLVALLIVSPPDYGTPEASSNYGAVSQIRNMGTFQAAIDLAASYYPAPGRDAITTSSSSLSGARTLVLMLFYSALLRMAQRLLFESGIIFLLEEIYKWDMAAAGMCMGAIGICNAFAQIIFSSTLAGRYEDCTLMCTLELTQLIGILIMVSSSGGGSLIGLLVGGTIAYCANAIWGGVNTAFCMKRSFEGSLASRKMMLVCNQVAIFTGIAMGGVSSRFLLSTFPNPQVLAIAMLAPCLLQMVMTMTMCWAQLRCVIPTLAIVAGLGLTMGALVQSFGGTGPLRVLSWHVFAMGLAWATFAPCGLWARKRKHAESASGDDMQKIIRLCTFAASILSLVGLLCIAAVKMQEENRAFGGLEIEGGRVVLKRGYARFVHALIGYGVMTAWVIQTLYAFMCKNEPESLCKYFGKKVTMAGLMACMVGTWTYLGQDGGWNFAGRSTITMVLLMMATGLLLPAQESVLTCEQ